jgi:hypothetical protein
MIRGWVQGGATVRRSNASLLNGTYVLEMMWRSVVSAQMVGVVPVWIGRYRLY